MNEYAADGLFLYEVLEDHHDELSEKSRINIWQALCKRLWATPNERETATAYATFSVPAKLQGGLADLFRQHCRIPYLVARTSTTEKDGWSLLRQKVNNLYSRYCDADIITSREYRDAVFAIKSLYFAWRRGEIFLTVDELKNKIAEAKQKAEVIRQTAAREKMRLSWEEYQFKVEEFLLRCMENYKPIAASGTFTVEVSYWSEDNYCVRYLCRCLDGYMKNYQKEYYGCKRGNYKYARCSCGAMFVVRGRNHKYCDVCSYKRKLIRQKQCMTKQRECE